MTETYREYIVATVNFEKRQYKHRVDFVDEQIAVTKELLENNQEVRSRVGEDIVAGFGRFADTYFVPRLSHGVYTMTPEQQNGEGHPVIAAAMDETVRLSREFSTPTLTQRQKAAETIAAWGPVRSSPYAVLLSTAHALAEGYADPLVLFTRGIPGRVKSIRAQHIVPPVMFTAAPTMRAVIYSRPVVALSLPDTIRNELDETFMLHDYVHVEQAVGNPIIGIPDTVHGSSELELADEHEAYGIAAAAIRGIEASGGSVTAGGLVQIEALRILEELAVLTPRLAANNPMAVFDRRIAAYMDELYSSDDVLFLQPSYSSSS